MAAARVLVVDDEPEIRELCRVNLEFEGFEVLEAGDGEAGLRLARQQRPDVVFLDVMMPGLDGWDVLRALKEDAATAAIPVVLLTARSGEDDRLRGWQEGILEFVGKPFNPLALTEWVHRALARDPNEEAARRAQVLAQLRERRDVPRLR